MVADQLVIWRHEHLPPEVRKNLKEVGWTEGLELAKLARKQGFGFESAAWLHKARSMPKEEFHREVEKELMGMDGEPSELIYFKVFRSQIPVIERAIETAAHILGSDLGQKNLGVTAWRRSARNSWLGPLSTGAIPRYCCNPFYGTTIYCQIINLRSSSHT
jgi:hypothetical protein